MALKFVSDIDLNQNELQNSVVQNLASAPATPKAGQPYFNTSTHKFMGYNGSAWVDLSNQGKTYTAGNGINTTSFASDEIAVYDASTSQKGIIEIATDTEATTGTSETLAVNPKQLATKVTANAAITGGTAAKITYDSKGLVTGGASLSASDIPDISATYQTKLSSTNKLSTDYISGLATVATTGAYSDLTGTPTVDQTYSGTSSNAQSGVAVKSAIDSAISSVYKPAGSVAFASLPTLSASIEGNVYNITDAFTTTSDFVEGSGKSYPAGTNVVCINTTGTTYKWDVLTGMVDLSGYQLANTAVTHTASTAVGGTTQPVYIASDGTATPITYYLGKTVPADAVFTDTTYSVFTGANGYVAGTSGLVKAPTATDNNKFLRGDCTWSDALENKATGTNSLTLLGNATSINNSINIGHNSSATVGLDNIAIGKDASAVGSYNTVIGDGASTTTGVQGTVALGKGVTASISNSFYVGLNGNSYLVLTSAGKIPSTLLISDTTPTSASINPITSGAVYTAITGMAKKSTHTNGALTASGGVCTWTIPDSKAPDCVCSIRETSSGAEVLCDVTYGSGSITVKINSTSNIAANTYTATVIG